MTGSNNPRRTTMGRSRPMWLTATTVAVVGLSISMASLSVSGQTASKAKASKKVPANKEWRDWAGSPEGTRYVGLNQFTKANVGDLEVAWTYPYAQTEVNPLVAHGVIYITGRNKSVIALDAATGKEIWIHDGMTGITERGLNYWESKDGKDRRLIFHVNGLMQEIDAMTGKSIRSFGDNGVVYLANGLGRDPETIRGSSSTPGKVFEDLIILGSGTGEGFYSPPGDLRAYNVITGKLVWQFHTVPHPGEFGYETWPKDAWKYVGGANTWGELSVDSARGIVYFPTGSPTTDFWGGDRVGDGLFGNCLLALDARTGKRLWHFQNVHHDIWDFDNVAAPALTTIQQNGKKIDVVALAGKTGFLYVFERATGKPIWPIEERPVSTQTDSPGEVLSPTQPIPTAPPPFVRQSMTVDDINPYILPDWERAGFKNLVARARYEGPFTPSGFDWAIHLPGEHGGANWGMTSSNPTNGGVYVIGYNVPAIMRILRPDERQGGRGAAAQGGAGAAGRGGVQAGPEAVPLIQEEAEAAIFRGSRAGSGGAPQPPAPTTFPPGPIVETGPPVKAPPTASNGRGGPTPAYPPDVENPPAIRYSRTGGNMDRLLAPPYTTLTAYDLNKGTIKWQIGLGDDYRVTSVGGPKGTGAASFLKTSVVSTSTGLVFVGANDNKIHIYDADTGKELSQLPLGATTSNSPSMYEMNGRQYLLVTASNVGTRGFAFDSRAVDPDQKGPTGLIAYALKK